MTVDAPQPADHGGRFAQPVDREGPSANREPIAIVGIGCRFPGGASSPGQFWQNLLDGVNGVCEVPPDRWSLEGFFDPEPGIPGRSVTKWGGFIDQIDLFDAGFFSISPREAAEMDPQQRIMLQVAFEALEDAGIGADRLQGSATGVFVGVSINDYAILQKHHPVTDSIHAGTGTALSIVANRISHRFDLRGPSVSVDTACSSSIVALDLACRNLWDGDCEVALSGGVNALLEPGGFLYFSAAGMMSTDGRVHAFDADGTGFVRAEGAGVVVLKTLSAAAAAGDRIYAVIRATEVNQDGSTPTLTGPSQEAQTAMLREICRKAAIPPEMVGYVEAHGTGTPVGDPIEAGAIGRVFGQARAPGSRLPIGSVKTQIGHLESAAGIAGLIKTVLSLHHRTLPPNLNFTRPNPAIPFDDLNIEVVTAIRPLDEATRLAVVSSFGFGGTNACAMLEAAPMPAPAASPIERPAERLTLVPISAASSAALRTRAAELAAAVGSTDAALADIAGTAALRRAHLAHRLAVVAGSTDELIERLDAFAENRPVPGIEDGAPAVVVAGRRSEPEPVAMVFAGQGGQSWSMARELLADDPVFRAAVDAFDAVFHKVAGWSIIDELLADEAKSRINSTAVTQPAIFAVQIGLVARWRAWGIEPGMVIGHSFGEVAAAYTAGALSLADAVQIIYHRGRLQDETQGSGTMAAVAMPAAELRRRLDELGEDQVEIAADNGPQMVTLAGETAALERFLLLLQEEDPDLFCRQLKVDYAAHSRQMESIRDSFVGSLGVLAPQPPSTPMISTVTGKPVGDMPLDADYWWRNVREPVLFQDALASAIDGGAGVFLEVGPHATLSGILGANLAAAGKKALAVPSLHAKHADYDQLYASLAALYVHGLPVRWETLADPRHRRVALPPYPWELQRYWADSEEGRASLFPPVAHPLLGRRSRGPEPVWTNEITLRTHPFIVDHRVDGAVVYPGAGYVEMALAAAREVLGEGALVLEEVSFLEALFMQDDQSVQFETVLDTARGIVRIYSRVRDGAPEWSLRMSARVRLGASSVVPFEQLEAGSEPITHDDFYAYSKSQGHDYGQSFQGVRSIRTAEGVTVGTVEPPTPLADKLDRYIAHPAVLDACLQVGIGLHGLKASGSSETSTIHLPTSAARLRLFKPPRGRLEVAVRLRHEDARRAACDIVATDESGDLVLVIDSFVSRKLPSRTGRGETAAAIASFQEFWQEAALDLPEATGDGGDWLVFSDSHGIGDALAQALKAAGSTPIMVQPGESFATEAEGGYRIRPAEPEDMQRLIDAVIGGHPDLAGVVLLWGLPGNDRSGHAIDMMRAQEDGLFPALHLVQALARHEASAPRLIIATRGAHVLPNEPVSDVGRLAERLAQAPLAGFVRTAANEQPQLRITLIDLDPDSVTNGDGAAADLMVEIAADSPELEAAIRGAHRFVNRVDAAPLESLPRRRVPAIVSEDTDYRLTMTAPGVFDNMLVTETPALRPGAGEAIIAVKAVGINFHDILSAAAMMPEGSEDIDAWEFLGLECAGVVRDVGPGVAHLRPGDRVMTPGKGCLGSAVRVAASAAQPIPGDISFIEAATLPTTFMTAHFALNHMGRMAAGERVLIHVATGGVGLAAIQLARLQGCEIFATAGSDRKRDFLRQLGIAHVMDSRSLDFADEVMAATDGRGVDLVLNSLPGPFIDKGLEILAPYGRFLELGKRDLFADKPIGLRALRHSNAFITIDLDGLAHDRPAELERVLGEVAAMLAEGRIEPLPAEVFGLGRTADAFKHMSKGLHIGKVVVTVDDPAQEMSLDPARPLKLAADGAYLVTGGLGGFGLEVAKWLGEHGAGQLVLMSRSGAASEEAQAAVTAIEAGGTLVTVVAGDVTDPADVARAVEAARADGRNLKGVVHAAMVLDDGFITQLDQARFTTALKPKLLGGWNLHEATSDAPLDFFVMFSSVAALLGSTGQANYVAGNAFLDKLAAHRRALGLPAVSVAWGALGGKGFVARNEAIAHYLESQGIAPVPPEEALAWLGRTLRLDPGAIAIARIDWRKLGKAQAALSTSPRTAHLSSSDEGRAGGGRARAEILAAPAARRPILTEKLLKAQVARVLRVEAGDIDGDRPLNELGLDSLTSFELKNRIETELGVDLPASKFLQKPTISGLAETILDKLGEADEAGAMALPDGADDAALPLTSWQQWLWWLEQQGEDGQALRLANHLSFAVRLRPALDSARLAASFERTLERHPGLRSRFVPTDTGIRVELLERHPAGLVVNDSCELDDQALLALLATKQAEPYDFENGPLVHLELFRRADNEDVVFLSAHHAVVDGWSLMLLTSELFADYFDAGDQQTLVERDVTFDALDYARWQRRFIASPEGEAQLAYWREHLANPGPPLPLPYDQPPDPRGKLAMRRGRSLQMVMSAEDSAATTRLAAALGTSRYVLMLAAFDLLLLRYTGRTDLPVSASAAARTRPEFERVIGSIYNFITFRTRLDTKASFRQLVDDVGTTVANGLAHQDYPCVDFFERVEPGHLGKRTALDQVAFQMLRPENLDDRGFGSILLNRPGAKMQFGSLEIETLSPPLAGCLRELTVYQIEHDGRIHLTIRYDADLFTATTAERILVDYQTMLKAAMARPDVAIGELIEAFAPVAALEAGED